jgi:HD-like signal output (HDOD) protein
MDRALEHYPGAGLGPDDLVAGVIELSSPPEIYTRITRLLDDPSSTSSDIATVLEKDPGLTARLLKIVNSAYYGSPSEIETVSRAITLVGNRELRSLVFATAVLEMFNGIPNDLVSMNSFWDDSLRCAVISQVLASHHHQKNEVEPIFVAGLLHEIGHLIIYHKLPELSREALLRYMHGGLDLYRAEREVFGFDYAAVGAALLRLWKLPPMLEQVVEFHIEPEKVPDFPLETAIVHLAKKISALKTFEESEVLMKIPLNSSPWKSAGIREDMLTETLQLIEEQYGIARNIIP